MTCLTSSGLKLATGDGRSVSIGGWNLHQDYAYPPASA